ncbi:MAG: helix-turn-helix domain-containing protein, partial [Candidatus Margulisiibacteriota bacterium]
MNDLIDVKRKQISDAIREGRPIPAENIGKWIRDIREVLGMTQKQMSKKLKISQPLLSRIEEKAENCAVKTLVKIARGLECEFMGVIISKDSIENIIKRRAEEKAKEMLKRTFANMAMEKQSPDN